MRNWRGTNWMPTCPHVGRPFLDAANSRVEIGGRQDQTRNSRTARIQASQRVGPPIGRMGQGKPPQRKSRHRAGRMAQRVGTPSWHPVPNGRSSKTILAAIRFTFVCPLTQGANGDQHTSSAVPKFYFDSTSGKLYVIRKYCQITAIFITARNGPISGVIYGV